MDNARRPGVLAPGRRARLRHLQGSEHPLDEHFRSEVEYAIAHSRQGSHAALSLLGLRPEFRLLDAGCGAGVHRGIFARALDPDGRVVGLDGATDRLVLAAPL